MNITLAQLNYTVGDIEGNTAKIINTMSVNSSSDIIVFSELCVTGYYPKDMLFLDGFLDRQAKAIEEICEASKSIKGAVVIGAVEVNNFHGKPFKNALYMIEKGQIIYRYYKQLLPTYGVFGEARHFEAGNQHGLFMYKGKRLGFLICEDSWLDSDDPLYGTDPAEQLVNEKLDLIISINASPSHLGKAKERIELIEGISEGAQCPVVYVNQVGGYDELVFDGGSFVTNKHGLLVDMASYFEEDVMTHDTQNKNMSFLVPDNYFGTDASKYHFLHRQLVTGIRDYCHKCGFTKAVIGSSGGIDSALTLALAVDALGADNVTAITMPNKFSSAGSVDDSVVLCQNLGVELLNYNIYPTYQAMCDMYDSAMQVQMGQLANENLQARIRGAVLMTFSNTENALVLSTGNKSELAVGYCTLYGDMNGGINVLGDVYKTDVFELCRHLNEKHYQEEIIPYAIIDKPPSAELAEGQEDTDSLPEYDVLDKILQTYIEGAMDDVDVIHTLVEEDGMDETEVKRIIALVNRNEYKRNQSPPIIRVTAKSFGYDRQMPLAAKYKV